MKWWAVSLLFLTTASKCFGQVVEKERPGVLKKVDVVEHLSQNIAKDIFFANESGDSVTFKRFFGGEKPVVLNLAYYKCPMLCGLIMNGLADVAKKSSLKMGKDYQVVSISINPEETPLLAKQKKERYKSALGNEEMIEGWNFLVGKEENIRMITESVGFQYYYDEEKGEYAHPSVLMILSPDGKMSRYLYGIEFKPNDFKLALLEAGDGKIGTTVDKLILSCYQYDPLGKGYAPMAANIMRLGGAFTVLVMATSFLVLWYRKKTKMEKNKTIINGDKL